MTHLAVTLEFSNIKDYLLVGKIFVTKDQNHVPLKKSNNLLFYIHSPKNGSSVNYLGSTHVLFY